MLVHLGFGGNAWNAEDLAILLHRIFPDRDIFTFHDRGYAPSTGSPSAQELLQDALVIHEDIAARLSPNRIVVVGLSIGSGQAAHPARSRRITGLVLVTPFGSLRALARDHYPWLPVGLLLRAIPSNCRGVSARGMGISRPTTRPSGAVRIG